MKRLLEKLSKQNKNLIVYFFLALIFLFSFILRIYNLDSIPLGFHLDEASLGYNGYSLLLTGKDEAGHSFPLYIDMFGDNRPTGYHYLTTIPIKIWGLNVFATRFPAALFGSLITVIFYFLALQFFKSRRVGLLASFLSALAPWSIVLSRASGEAVVALFFIIFGYFLFLNGIRKQQGKMFLLSAFFLCLSFFFYHTPRVFVPLLILVSVIYLFPVWIKFKINTKLSLLGAFIILSVVAFSLVFLIKGGTGRFSQVNIFSFPEVRLLMEEQIREDGVLKTSVPVTRVFHNKLINYSLGFLNNYSDYFTGKFLFLSGGLPIWYRVPAVGLIFIIELPFLLLGLFYIFTSKEKYYKLPILWLLIAPVTAAITRDDVPNINRAIVMFPMIELIAAYGFWVFSKKLGGVKFKLLVLFVSVLFALNVFYFLHQYFVHAQINKNWYRNEGFDEMATLIKKDYASYEKIIITKSLGGIYPLILFYTQYDPKAYQAEGSPKDKDYSGFGKFFFASASCPSLDKDSRFPKVKRIIYVDNGTCPDYPGLEKKQHKYIYRKDGTRVFRIVYE